MPYGLRAALRYDGAMKFLRHAWMFFRTRLLAPIFLTAIAIVLVIGGISIAIHIDTAPFIYQDLTAVPHTEAALVLGAAVTKGGALSPVLRDRANAAAQLYGAGKVDKILVSGSNSSVEYNEVNPVGDYLIGKGVPPADIFLDHAGFDTYSSIYRAQTVFLVKSMTIVTQSFHLPRATFIARSLGIEAYGFDADSGHYLFKNNVHEWLADVKAIVNLILQRQPKFLGATIPIWGDSESEQ